MNTFFIKSLLLDDRPKLMKLFSSLSDDFLVYVPVVLMVSVIMTIILTGDVKGILKRLVFVVFLLVTYSSIHYAMVDFSLASSEKILGSSLKNNEVIKLIVKKERLSKKESKSFDSMSLTDILISTMSASKEETSYISSIIFSLSMIGILFTKVLYTIVYYSAPLFAFLGGISGIFEFSSKNIFVGAKTTLFCCIVPFVVSVCLLILIHTVYDGIEVDKGVLVFKHYPSFVVMFVTSIFLFSSCWISYALANGTGLENWTSGMSMMAAYSGFSMVTRSASNILGSLRRGAGTLPDRARRYVGERTNQNFANSNILPNQDGLKNYGEFLNNNSSSSEFLKGFSNGKKDGLYSGIMGGVSAYKGYTSQREALRSFAHKPLEVNGNRLSGREKFFYKADSILNKGKNRRAFDSSARASLRKSEERVPFRPVHENKSPSNARGTKVLLPRPPKDEKRISKQ